VESP